MTRKQLSLTLFLFSMVLPVGVHAGCKSDCRDEYNSAREDCMLLHEDPDEADDLQMCLADAKSQYEDCIEECDS